MTKRKNGFTLIELLAVIVILGIILTIATTVVVKNINKSRENARYTSAKEIVEIASAYMSSRNISEVTIYDLMVEGYLEKDVTNPKTGKSDLNVDSAKNIKIYLNSNVVSADEDDDINSKIRNFNGYAIAYDDNESTQFSKAIDDVKENPEKINELPRVKTSIVH